MKRSLLFCLTTALLLLTAHRLPAPIAEESPTPVPEQSAKPKAKHAAKPEPKSVASASATNPARQQPSSKQRRFAGTWTGTESVPGTGNIQCTYVINAAENSVIGSSPGFPAVTCVTTVNGRTIRKFSLP